MYSNIICPISTEKADSSISRLTVFINAALMIAFLLTLKPILLYIVTLDYGIRAFGYTSYSPLCKISTFVSKMLKWKIKMVDKAPKMFASRLGLICAVLGTIFISIDMPFASIAIIGLFAVLALLDSVANLCVGCMIYNFFVFPFFYKA